MAGHDRARYGLPLLLPSLLAEMTLRVDFGCARVSVARPWDDLGGAFERPWVIGYEPNVLAESWAYWHRIHRRKRGFTAVVERLTTLVQHTRPVAVQVWEDAPGIDRSLVEKWGLAVGLSVTVVDRAEIARLWRRFEAEPPPERAGESELPEAQNPLERLLRERRDILTGDCETT